MARAYTTLMNNTYRRRDAVLLYQHSDTDEREIAGKRLASGDLDYIFNVGLFTEGYDIPNLLRVVWAAPTASLVRYTQGVGRVFRTHSSRCGVALKGGPEDAEGRRLLIAQSPKPYGIVVTYYPQNCAHELCDPVDILGGDDLPENVKAAAKGVQAANAAASRGSNPEDDIETGRLVVELRALLDEEAKAIKAKATVEDVAFDPMSGPQAGRRVALDRRRPPGRGRGR